jgi:hypothetical protein
LQQIVLARCIIIFGQESKAGEKKYLKPQSSGDGKEEKEEEVIRN